MAGAKDYDPRTLVQEPETLTRTVDAATALTFKHQTLLHRQRAGAARIRLARAVANGDPAEEIARLQSRLDARTARAAQVEAQFAAANIVGPAPDAALAQVFGQVVGDAGETPLTAALLSASGEPLAAAEVAESRGFLLQVRGGFEGARLQVSDAAQQILFRDGGEFGAETGAIVTRRITLEAPKPPSAPPPTELLTPRLVGQTEAAACAILFRLGVADIDLSTRTDRGTPGVVLEQSPETGAPLDPAAGAKLVISVAPEGDDPPEPQALEMPDLVGSQIADARARAGALGIALSELSRADQAPSGEVVGQSPEAGAALTRPARATVVFSAGLPDRPTFETPRVVGETERAATLIAREAGFAVARQTVREGGRAGLVIDQKPMAGEVVPAPAILEIVVDLGVTRGDGEATVPQLVDLEAEEAEKVAAEAGFAVSRNEIRRDGRTNVVVEQKPEAGETVSLPATIEMVVNVASIPRPGDPSLARDLAFLREFDAAAARDDRIGANGLDLSRAGSLSTRLSIANRDEVEALVAMDNAVLAERTGLKSRSEARTLRSVMRGALAQTG
ncbi:MAG: PASTA domain-containing protein [Pseudomonadota bacterium]